MCTVTCGHGSGQSPPTTLAETASLGGTWFTVTNFLGGCTSPLPTPRSQRARALAVPPVRGTLLRSHTEEVAICGPSTACHCHLELDLGCTSHLPGFQVLRVNGGFGAHELLRIPASSFSPLRLLASLATSAMCCKSSYFRSSSNSVVSLEGRKSSGYVVCCTAGNQGEYLYAQLKWHKSPTKQLYFVLRAYELFSKPRENISM